MGFPATHMAQIQRFLKSTGYPFEAEGDNIAYHMFVGPMGVGLAACR